ncbi:hypothetical protein [Anaerosphaera multitolerans]|uniref:hypothetical protein n=1 Tax=Anaerosphaera multitolerans TaxID=2487351 RepID=UPI0013E2A95E|nr:hypothetical protein [Anaerosphaera multitolerans]
MDKEKMEELEKLCKPLIKYLEDNYHPHTHILISMDDIKLYEIKVGIPIKND